MPAIDQAAAEAALAFRILIEMNLRGILIEPRRHHVFGFLDGDAVDMVDAFALFIIIPEMGRAGSNGVERLEGGAGGRHEMRRADDGGEMRSLFSLSLNPL